MSEIGFSRLRVPDEVLEARRVAAKRSDALRLLGVAALMVAIPAGGWFGYFYYQVRAAEGSIGIARSACASGNRAEFSRRYVEAQSAIRDVPWMDSRSALGNKLSNELAMAGCRF
jgi:hypothetical protein